MDLEPPGSLELPAAYGPGGDISINNRMVSEDIAEQRKTVPDNPEAAQDPDPLVIDLMPGVDSSEEKDGDAEPGVGDEVNRIENARGQRIRAEQGWDIRQKNKKSRTDDHRQRLQQIALLAADENEKRQKDGRDDRHQDNVGVIGHILDPSFLRK